MKKIFERIISKFKEFWGNNKSVSKTYSHNEEYHLYRSNSDNYNLSVPLKFMISNIREFKAEDYFDDINIKCKRRHCIYIVKSFDGANIENHKRLVTFWEIIGNSRFDVFDSNRIDIDFWNHEACTSVIVKRKVVILSISEIFMN